MVEVLVMDQLLVGLIILCELILDIFVNFLSLYRKNFKNKMYLNIVFDYVFYFVLYVFCG